MSAKWCSSGSSRGSTAPAWVGSGLAHQHPVAAAPRRAGEQPAGWRARASLPGPIALRP